MSRPRSKPPAPVYDLLNGPPAPPPAPFVDLRIRPRHSEWSASPECRRRLSDLKQLIMHRHNEGPCDTDDGASYLAVAVSAFIDQDDGYILSWARTWVPRLSDGEILEVIREARDRYERYERFLTAQEVGNELNVTLEEREKLDIRTMRPAGWTNRRFKAYQKKRRAEAAQKRAASKRTTPRPPSKVAVALELGISISTYKLHLKLGKRTHPPQASEPISSPIELTLPSANKPAHGPAQNLTGAGGQTAHERGAEAAPTHPARVQRDSAARYVPAALAGIRPGGKTKLTAASRTGAVALPAAGCEIPRDLLTDVGHADTAACASATSAPVAVLAEWSSGLIPDAVIAAVELKAIALGLRDRSAVARAIGIERGTWSNAARRVFGLSADKAALVKAWLIAA